MAVYRSPQHIRRSRGLQGSAGERGEASHTAEEAVEERGKATRTAEEVSHTAEEATEERGMATRVAGARSDTDRKPSRVLVHHRGGEEEEP